RRVLVSQVVEVTVDESKFDAAFMQTFRDTITDFDTIEQHVLHLAQLAARGVIHEFDDHHMIEGYGPRRSMGIALRIVPEETETEIQP
ncbi:MAG TPA: hypothetical protein VF678_06985, partial [bacterium]